MRIIFYSLTFIFLVSITYAQTNQWQIVWDKNPEPDISNYIVYKSKDNLNYKELARTNASETKYIDNNIEPGILYYYKIKAINQTGRESQFSDEAHAAIPKIVNFPHTFSITENNENTFNLEKMISDPANQTHLMDWKVESNHQIEVALNSNKTLKIKAPATWKTGDFDTLKILVTNPQGFSFLDEMVISYGDNNNLETNNNFIGLTWINKNSLNLGDDGEIEFLNLPINSTLIIYNSFGEEVFTKTKLTKSFKWNAENNEGDTVLFGLYIFKIMNSNNVEVAQGSFRVVPSE